MLWKQISRQGDLPRLLLRTEPLSTFYQEGASTGAIRSPDPAIGRPNG